jgi:hypothetical protein
MKRLLLGIALLVVSAAASADDIALYKVEVIVFENLDPSAVQAELWPDNPGTPPLDNAVELAAITAAPPPAGSDSATVAPDTDATLPSATAAAPPVPPPPSPPPTWQWLNDSELGLNAQVRRLNDSQRYKTIVHVGWIQPVDSTDRGKAVHIYDGMESSHTDASADQTQATAIPLAPEAADPATAAAPDSDGPAAPREPDLAATAGDAAQATEENTGPSPAAEPPHILDGTFTLRRGRFLHVDVDLGYTKTVSVEQAATTTDTPPVPPQATRYYVRMTDSLRVRNDQLHYLDHPLFGVLFMVTPYEPDGADAASD